MIKNEGSRAQGVIATIGQLAIQKELRSCLYLNID